MASTGSVAEGGQDGLGARRNWLRAGVLGVNDGLVLTAGLVIGVAGATNSTKALLTAGLAGLRAGSLSLAAGEYVSVSSHRDSERIQARMTHPGQIATIDIDNTSPRIGPDCQAQSGCARWSSHLASMLRPFPGLLGWPSRSDPTVLRGWRPRRR